MHLTLIPCDYSNKIIVNNHSCLKSYKDSAFDWKNEKKLLAPSFEVFNTTGKLSEDNKMTNIMENQIYHKEFDKNKNLNEERAKLTFLNFHPNQNNEKIEKSTNIGKPPLGKKLRRKTEPPAENFISLGESEIYKSPVNSRIIYKQNY